MQRICSAPHTNDHCMDTPLRPASGQLNQSISRCKFEFAPLPDQEARNFELGQYVAKAWQSDDGSWKCYAARINLMTKNGPWIIFESDRCARHRQLPDSYQIATR